MVNVTTTPVPAPTLPGLVARFLESCRHLSPRSGRRLSPRTLEYYRMCLDGLTYFAARSDWPEPGQLTRDHLRQFMYYLDSEPHRWAGDGRRGTFKAASPATVHHYLKVAKTFFTWAADEDYLPAGPEIASLLRFRLPTPQYQDVEPYSDDEINALLAVCERDLQRGHRYLGARNKAVISLFVDTGLRLSELAEMALSALDPQLQQVRVLGKGSKFRVVPINGEARKALKTYLTQFREGGGDAVWLTEDGQPLSAYAIRMMVGRLKRRAGVTSEGGAHRFRHYFATRYLENGGDLNVLRLLLGHATLYMVLRYTRFVEARRALSASAACSPLDRLTRGGARNPTPDNWGWRR